MRFSGYGPLCILLALIGPMSSPAASQSTSPSAPTGIAIDEQYRRQFADCDSTDRFGTLQFPIRNAKGKIVWYGCRTDPSHFARFERIAAQDGKPEAILWEAKLAHDLDGSPTACNTPGRTDQCGTTLMLRPTAAMPCPKPIKQRPYCLPVDAATIPYIVIPTAAPRGIDSGAFGRLTNVHVGDVGMVVSNGRAVPVIVADTGPAYKIGEGSTALLRALSSDGKPHTLPRGVVFVAFPGSTVDRDVNADTLAAEIKRRATALWTKL